MPVALKRESPDLSIKQVRGRCLADIDSITVRQRPLAGKGVDARSIAVRNGSAPGGDFSVSGLDRACR